MEKSALKAVGAEGGRPHVVQFYESPDLLADVVGRFVLRGLQRDEPVVVISTEEQERLLRERLGAWDVPVERRRIEGALTFLDAEVVLSSFMVDGRPDRQKFSGVLSPLLEGAVRRSPRGVRAFGSMVDILWAKGSPQAALDLELLWCELCARIPLTLLCAYGIDRFPNPFDGDGLSEICEHHDRTFPVEGFEDGRGVEARRAAVELLRARARTRRTQAEERRQLQAELLESRRELEEQRANLRGGFRAAGAHGGAAGPAGGR